jgi:2'-5' RNA ligase
MRTFVGAPVSETVLAAARDLQQWIRRGGHNLRFVPPENLHFTLKFLGEISEEDAHRLGAALARLSSEFEPFPISVGSLGGFPHLRAPRVLWVGVQFGADNLTRLAGEVESVCLNAGLKGDQKPFRPHLTLARSRERRPRSMNLPERALEVQLGEMTVDRVVLLQSQLGPHGATYTPLAEVRLGGRADPQSNYRADSRI